MNPLNISTTLQSPPPLKPQLPQNQKHNPINNNHGFTMLAVALSLILIPTMILVATQQYSVSIKTAAIQHSTFTKNNLVSIKNWLISNSKDIDSDGIPELLHEGTGNTLPLTVPIRSTDDWGKQVLYYTWDLGAANGDATYSQNHTAPPIANLIGRIISAGKDGIFQTSASSTLPQGDDIVLDIFTTDTVTNTDNSGWVEDAANNKVTLKNPGRWVGIGTSTPQYNLSVEGTLGPANNTRAGGGHGGIDFVDNGIGYGQSAKIYTFKDNSTGEFYGFTNDYDGTGAQLSLIAKQTVGNIGFYTGNPAIKRMTIQNNGVISVHNDGYSLYGPNSTWGATLRIGGNGNVDNYASVVTTNGNLYLDAANGPSATYLNFYKGTGGVYFGNGAGSVVASVNTNGRMDAQSQNGNGGYISSGNYGGTGNAAYFPAGLWSNGANAWIYGNINVNGPIADTGGRYRINPTGNSWFNGGNFGIGTSSPGTKLDVNGNIRAASEIYPSGGVGGYIYGDSNGIRTSGNLLSNGNIYWGTKGIWLDSWLNQAVRTDSSPTFQEVYSNGWFRSNGNQGWFNSTYGGGIYMTDSTWIRTYNGKGLWTDGDLHVGGNTTLSGNFTVTGNTTLTGTVTAQSRIYARGGISDDTHANLSLYGGQSGNTKIEGTPGTNGLIFPDGTLQTTAAGSGVYANYQFKTHSKPDIMQGTGKVDLIAGNYYFSGTMWYSGCHNATVTPVVVCRNDPICAWGFAYYGPYGDGGACYSVLVSSLPIQNPVTIY